MNETTDKDLATHLSITSVWLWNLLKDNSARHVQGMAEFYGVTVSDFIKRGES